MSQGTRGRAFSLIEVAFALAVATFAILVIVALLPAGIKSTKDSLSETQAINVLSQVIADRQATPLNLNSTIYQLPALTNAMPPAASNFGVTANYQYTSTLTQAAYRVDYQVTPPLAGSLNPFQVYLKVAWPAYANGTNGGQVETVATFPEP